MILAYIGYLLFKGAFNVYLLKKQMDTVFKGAKPQQTRDGVTVKCEECDAYAAEELSVSVHKRGKALYFCSDSCKEKYLKAH